MQVQVKNSNTVIIIWDNFITGACLVFCFEAVKGYRYVSRFFLRFQDIAATAFVRFKCNLLIFVCDLYINGNTIVLGINKEITYQTREDIILSEDGEKYIVYGVESIDAQGTIVLSFPDVFFDQQKAKDLAALCNEIKLAFFHLPDVIQDALDEQYMG